MHTHTRASPVGWPTALIRCFTYFYNIVCVQKITEKTGYLTVPKYWRYEIIRGSFSGVYLFDVVLIRGRFTVVIITMVLISG